MDQKSKILKEAKAFATKAGNADSAKVKLTLKSGETSSLGKVVDTKEKAEIFMKMLRSL